MATLLGWGVPPAFLPLSDFGPGLPDPDDTDRRWVVLQLPTCRIVALLRARRAKLAKRTGPSEPIRVVTRGTCLAVSPLVQRALDRMLALRAARCDESAWVEIWETCRPAVMRELTRIVPDEAEDLWSDLCVALLQQRSRRLRGYNGRKAGLKTYLKTIARNRALSLLRRRAIRLPHAGTSVSDPLELTLERERLTRGRALFASLGSRDQELLCLHICEQVPTRTIATRMGISQATVYSKKHKIARRLARLAA